MSDLVKKYRPNAFADVAGHEELVSWLRGQAMSRGARSCLLSGPSGIGKTSLGLLYAKALVCEAPLSTGACNECENCREFDRSDESCGVLRFQCGEHTKVDEVKEALANVRYAPVNKAKRRVLLMDEIQALSYRSFEALLYATESPPPWLTFILLTTAPNKVNQALLARVRHFRCQELSIDLARDYLARICRAENRACDEEGLQALVLERSRTPRSLLRDLEATFEVGAVTKDNVLAALGRDIKADVAAYVKAVLSDDRAGTIEAIRNWAAAPSVKKEALQGYFSYVYLSRFLKIAIDDPVMANVPGQLSDSLAELVECAEDVERFWLTLLNLIENANCETETLLSAVISRIHLEFRAIRNIRRRKRAAAPSSKGASHKGGRIRSPGMALGLAWEEIRSSWRAASFLIQEYGKLFNARLTLHLVPNESSTYVECTALVSELLRQLQYRIRGWTKSPEGHSFWMYRHEVRGDGGLTSRVVLSVPPAALAKTMDWVDQRFLPRHRDEFRYCRAVWSLCRFETSESWVRYHWNCVRSLSRQVDRDLAIDDGLDRKLVDVLKIPRRFCARLTTVPGRGLGICDALNRKSQLRADKRLPLLSAVDDRAWDWLDRGWELQEHRDRLASLAAIDADVIAGKHPVGSVPSAEVDAKMRRRSWVGWWIAASPNLQLSSMRKVVAKKRFNINVI